MPYPLPRPHPARRRARLLARRAGMAALVLGVLFTPVPSALAQEETGSAQETDASEADAPTQADTASRFGRVTGFPIPRFVSLKSGEVNMRHGPGSSYAIDWVYHRQGMPMEVIGEYDNWRRLRAHDGTQGWVHYQLLDGRRMALVQGAKVELHRRQDMNERSLVALISPGVILRLHKCTPKWCRAEVSGYKGWVTRDHLWGVYPGEVFD